MSKKYVSMIAAAVFALGGISSAFAQANGAGEGAGAGAADPG